MPERPPASEARGLHTRLKEAAAVIIFVLFMGVLCGVAWFNPFYNWDVLPYTALVEVSSSDPVTLHADAYRAIEHDAPPSIVRSFKGEGPDPRYRRDMVSNPWHFAEQLPFYSVKPLYLLLLAAIHRAGPSGPEAATLVSVCSFAILGLVLFVWMRRSAGGLLAAVGTGLLLSTAEFIGTGAETTPDALFAALALVAIFLVFAEKRTFAGLCILSVLPLVRADGLVLLALVLAYLVWTSPEFSRKYAFILLVAEVLVMEGIKWLAGGYGFETLFYHSFVVRIPAPAELNLHVTWRQYFHALHMYVLEAITTHIPLYLLLGLASLKASRGHGVLRYVAWLGLAYMAIHILAFPIADSRFLVLSYALFVLWTVHVLTTPPERLSEP